MADLRSRDGLAAIVDAQRREISQLETDRVVLEDALRAKGGGRRSRQAAVAAVPMVVVAAETIRFTTAAELSTHLPVAPPWFVPGFVAPGVVAEVVGKLKASGKTTFVGWMVRALLDGADFLGRPTRKTAVVWLTEERPTSFLETLKRAGLTTRTDLHILHWHDAKHLTWPVVMRAATTHALSVGAGVLIVDTVSQFAGLRGDAENNSGDALAAVEPLQSAAAEGLGIIANRHERKGGGEVGESGRGSSAFSGAVDIVVAIRRGEGQTKPTVRVLHTLSRFTETPDTLVIDLTEQGYVALGTEGTVAVLEAERTLLDRLPTTEADALTLNGILDGHAPRIARTVAQAALQRLTTAAVATRTGNGKRGSPYRYFRAIEVSAGTQITRCGRNGNESEADCERV